nr:hypothetical protein [Sinorhizobium sp. BG8]
MDPRAGGSAVAAKGDDGRNAPKAEDGQKAEAAASAAGGTERDPAFDGFLATGRSKLEEIDSLLKGEGS